MRKNLAYAGLMALLLTAAQSCKIENDIPYPTVVSDIEAFEVEGQCASPDNGNTAATINTANRTVSLYVDDTVDLTQLRVTRFNVSNDATIRPDTAACADPALFPSHGFDAPDNLADTRVDFSQPVNFVLHTYQDYVWTVSVTQIIERTIDIAGQTRAVVDPETRTAIVYVSAGQDRSNLQVNRMDLGGASGTVTPDPTTVHDFTSPRTFQVTLGWEDTPSEWTVFVYNDEEGSTPAAGDLFPMTTRAVLNGNIESGKTPVVEYCEAQAADWMQVPAENISVNGTQYTAQLTGLSGSTTYRYRVTVDGVSGAEQTFTTAPATPLPNGSFDDWSSEPANNGTLWLPWAAGDESFWDTGNKGATTIGDSNTIPTTDTGTGSGQAAMLQSKWAVLKLASGNIFAGSYVKTDGTNGILSFGRPFEGFPTTLRLQYKYVTSPITRIAEDALSYLRDRPDSCHIYVALANRSQPYEIRTRPSERQLFNKNDPDIIAYGEFICGQNVPTYQTLDIPLEYRYNNRTPNLLVIVATASKYGDYFVGGDATTLWLDELELVYE